MVHVARIDWQCGEALENWAVSWKQTETYIGAKARYMHKKS